MLSPARRKQEPARNVRRSQPELREELGTHASCWVSWGCLRGHLGHGSHDVEGKMERGESKCEEPGRGARMKWSGGEGKVRGGRSLRACGGGCQP